MTANYTGTMTDTLARDTRETLYITDAELIRRMGVPEKIARQAISVLDHNPRSGFPKKDPLWGKRRYWPAVKLYLDRHNGLSLEPHRRTSHG
jgi:hypothetical protein